MDTMQKVVEKITTADIFSRDKNGQLQSGIYVG